MCVDCRGASIVLDALWADREFRAFFVRQGYDLAALSPLLHEVFAPAYRRVRRSLEGGPLEILEARVMDDVFCPFNARPHFLELWRAWSQEERAAFLRQQIALPLGERLAAEYPGPFAEAYYEAFRAYLRGGL